MSALTRSALQSGSYFQSFSDFQDSRWSTEQIERSLWETMQRRPPSSCSDVWVFGYGSLMWNPALEFDESRVALLHGWHRSFCLRMVSGRASPSVPGRMLAVERGGLTYGLAFRLPSAVIGEELPLIWTREMLFGSYRPTWTPVTFEDGRSVSAITFAADPTREQYQPDASVDVVAPIIAAATGPFGSNAEYVLNLHKALEDCGARDPYIEALAAGLESVAGKGAT